MNCGKKIKQVQFHKEEVIKGRHASDTLIDSFINYVKKCIKIDMEKAGAAVLLSVSLAVSLLGR